MGLSKVTPLQECIANSQLQGYVVAIAIAYTSRAPLAATASAMVKGSQGSILRSAIPLELLSEVSLSEEVALSRYPRFHQLVEYFRRSSFTQMVETFPTRDGNTS